MTQFFQFCNYNTGRNILELCNILVQVPVAKIKSKLDL